MPQLPVSQREPTPREAAGVRLLLSGCCANLSASGPPGLSLPGAVMTHGEVRLTGVRRPAPPRWVRAVGQGAEAGVREGRGEVPGQLGVTVPRGQVTTASLPGAWLGLRPLRATRRNWSPVSGCGQRAMYPAGGWSPPVGPARRPGPPGASLSLPRPSLLCAEVEGHTPPPGVAPEHHWPPGATGSLAGAAMPTWAAGCDGFVSRQQVFGPKGPPGTATRWRWARVCVCLPNGRDRGRALVIYFLIFDLFIMRDPEREAGLAKAACQEAVWEEARRLLSWGPCTQEGGVFEMSLGPSVQDPRVCEPRPTLRWRLRPAHLRVSEAGCCLRTLQLLIGCPGNLPCSLHWAPGRFTWQGEVLRGKCASASLGPRACRGCP